MSLVAIDVGGTNVRFAMVDSDSSLSAHQSFLCADFATINDAFSAFAATTDVKISAAAICIAGPVKDDWVSVTNNHWVFSKHQLCRDLGLQQLLVVNDFTAQALAQADPAGHGNIRLLEGKSQSQAPLLVIGPGTGLGVSALIPAASGLIPIEGEGGHVGLSPQSDEEMKLFEALAAELPFVSVEDVISGRGLERIYQHLSSGQKKAAPHIGMDALAQEGLDRDAAQMMLGLLGTVIADSALMLGCWRGVVIAGGIVAQLQPLIATSAFADRLRHGGLMSDLLTDLPVWLSVDPHAGLRGAAAAFENENLRGRIIAG